MSEQTMTDNTGVEQTMEWEGGEQEGSTSVEHSATPPARETAPEQEATKEAQSKTRSSSKKDEVTPSSATEAPAFTPDYKVKVMDEEKEIPELFRSLIKDGKTQSEIKDIFNKVYGFDHVKPKYETLKTSFTQVQNDHTSLLNQIQEIREMVQHGDMDSFFKRLGIGQETVMQYVLDKINYQELPPEQKAILDAKRQAEQQAYQLQKQNASFQEQLHAQTVQARTFALDSALARAELKPMVDSFESRFGAGAFKRAVIERGQLTWFQSQGKVDLSPEKAIEEVIQLYRLNEAAPASATIQAPGATAPQQQRTNTIPNVGASKTISPVKSKPKSIDDLKKLYSEMQ